MCCIQLQFLRHRLWRGWHWSWLLDGLSAYGHGVLVPSSCCSMWSMKAHLIHPNSHPRPLRRGSLEGEHFTLGCRELQGSFEVDVYIKFPEDLRQNGVSRGCKYQCIAKLLLNLTCPGWFPQNICPKKQTYPMQSMLSRLGSLAGLFLLFDPSRPASRIALLKCDSKEFLRRWRSIRIPNQNTFFRDLLGIAAYDHPSPLPSPPVCQRNRPWDHKRSDDI